MKKWIIIVIVVIGAVAIYFLIQNSWTWQTLTMIGAAIAAPFKFIAGLFTDKEAEIRKKHEEIRAAEKLYQEDLESKIKQRESNIESLSKEVELLDAKLNALESKRALVNEKVEKMSLDELSREGRRLFGD